MEAIDTDDDNNNNNEFLNEVNVIAGDLADDNNDDILPVATRKLSQQTSRVLAWLITNGLSTLIGYKRTLFSWYSCTCCRSLSIRIPSYEKVLT